MKMIPEKISEQVDKEYTKIASKYTNTREIITIENLLWFQNLKNGLIEKIKRSEGTLKDAYEWRLQLLAQHFSDEVDLVNEVNTISRMYTQSTPLISYIPFTKKYYERKESEEKLKLLPKFKRELQDIHNYVSHRTLKEIIIS